MPSAARKRDLPTIPDVAGRAGVSTATAARALGGYGSVSATARQRVLDAATELGYRTNAAARSMITGQTRTLGMVVADIENTFFAQVTRGFTDVARAAGFDVILVNTDERIESERAALTVLQQRRVDGIAVTPASSTSSEHLRAAHDTGAALVLIDRRVRALAVDTVTVNNRAAARTLVEHLIAAGHRRIGLVSGIADVVGEPAGHRHITTVDDRLAGYRQALTAHDVAFRPELVCLGDFHRDAARANTVTLLGRPDPPTALFATDSTIALGVLEGIRDLNLRVPDDVSVAAFDDADWMNVVRPPLTVVAQPVYDLGAEAARLLTARVLGHDGPPVRRVLPTRLIVRGSIAAPAAVRRGRSS
jgi:LacI family transcriptional regulator